MMRISYNKLWKICLSINSSHAYILTLVIPSVCLISTRKLSDCACSSSVIA